MARVGAAAESPQIARMRQKLEERATTQTAQITPEAMLKAKRLIQEAASRRTYEKVTGKTLSVFEDKTFARESAVIRKLAERLKQG